MELSLVFKLAIALGAALFGVASWKVLKLPKDNPVEQVAEKIIDSAVGAKVDLSPGN